MSAETAPVADGSSINSAAGALRLRSRMAVNVRENLARVVLYSCGLFSLLVTICIVCVLGYETFQFFGMEEVSLSNFLSSTKWSPMSDHDKQFGIWPLLCGTMLVTVIAMSVALPLGLLTAIYLSEYAPRRVRSFLKPMLEILAGIPTVVYGYFALTVITPGLKYFHDGFNVYNAFSAGLAVGILCLPTVCSLSEDALRAVPRSLREGAYALGGTKFEVSTKVVLPAAISGVISAFLLAIARAVGETMIVALAAGNTPTITADPRSQIQTMTGFIVQIIGGDTSNFDVAYYSLYAVAIVLFIATLLLTVVGHLIRKRFREAYQ